MINKKLLQLKFPGAYYSRSLKRYLLFLIILGGFSIQLGICVPGYKSTTDTIKACELYEKACYFEDHYEYDSALKYFHLAFHLFANDHNYKKMAVCLLGISEKYRWMGYADSALYYATQAVHLGEKYLEPFPSESGSAFYQLGSAFNNINRYEEAIEAFNKAIHIWQQNPGLQHPHKPRTYANMGTIYSKKGDFDRALTYYHKALEIFQSYHTPDIQLALLYSNIGVAYEDKSLLEEALKYNTRALQIRTDNWGEDHPVTAISLHNIGMVHLKMSNYPNAIHYFQEALAIWDNDITADVAAALNNLGLLYFNQKNYHQAKTCFQKALAMRKILYPAKHPELAQSYNNLADLYLRIRKPDSARIHIKNALFANILNNELESIENFYDKTLSKIQLLESLQLYARALYMTGEADKDSAITYYMRAFSYYMAAINVIERIRLDYRFETSKLYFSEIQKNVYNEAVFISILLFNVTGESFYKDMAFYSAERNKASVLLEMINEAEAQINSYIPDSIVNELYETRLNLQFYENLLQQEIVFSETSDSGQISYLSKKVVALRLKYNYLIDEIEMKYPVYYSLKYSNIVYPAQMIQQCIKSDEVLIEYFIIDSSEITKKNYLISFIITPNEVQVVQHEYSKKEKEQIVKYRKYVENRLLDPEFEEFKDYVYRASNLYNFLLRPAKSWISNKHLIIIPDGLLSYIPFEALLTANPDVNMIDFRNLPYSVLQHSYSYGFSATTVFMPNSKTKQKKLNTFLGVAPSFKNRRGRISYRRNMEISQLPGATDEIKAIQALIGGHLLIEDEATKENFLDKAPFYKIIHLATHGYLNDEYPMQSSLFFSADSIRIGSDILTIKELYGLRLNAQLVVLSACNTGMGQLQKGEGIMSLARGFSCAGVPSIVMTLWEVNDRIGTSLMSKFYYYLSKGNDKAKALQLAKIDYINHTLYMEKLQPYYWSGYIQIGSFKPVLNNKIYVIIPVLVLITIIVFLMLKRGRKKLKSPC